MFKFKGVSSKDMKVLAEEEDFVAKSSQRVETIRIDGRDGAIYNPLGYSNINIRVRLQILDNSKLDEVLAWLDGEGKFEYEDRITTARFYNDISPQRRATIKFANLRFIRDPFWYKKNDEFVIVTTEVENEGNISSRPIIRLEKDNDETVDITIGGVRFSYTFQESDTYVEIDCEEMEAQYDGFNRNRNLEIGYNFPLLPVGVSNITVHEGDAIIKIKRKDRWL